MADPPRRDFADASGEIGEEVRQHLDEGRLAADGLDDEAGQAAARPARRAGPPRQGAARDALRQPVDRVAAGRAARRGRHPRAGAAGLSAVLGRDDGQRDRRRGALGADAPACARVPLREPLPRRQALHRRAGRQRARPLEDRRPRRAAGHELPRHARAHAGAGRPLPLRVPEDRPAAGRGAGALRCAVQGDLPEPLRQGALAGALHRADAAGPRRTRAEVGRPDLPGFLVRLHRDAGRDRHGSARGLPAQRRTALQLHPLPERPPRPHPRAGGDRRAAPAGLAHDRRARRGTGGRPRPPA